MSLLDAKDFTEQFKLTCKKCGSADVVIDIERGTDYGGETGYDPGHISAGCNACKQNDFYLSI